MADILPAEVMEAFGKTHYLSTAAVIATASIFGLTYSLTAPLIALQLAERGYGEANLWATLPFVKQWLFSPGPGVTWADERYMHSFFTITPAQAAVSPLAVYQARAGVLDVHLNGVVTCEISSRWSLGASAYAARLRGDAAGSPVTLRRDQTTTRALMSAINP
jgi:MipA family protein